MRVAKPVGGDVVPIEFKVAMAKYGRLPGFIIQAGTLISVESEIK